MRRPACQLYANTIGCGSLCAQSVGRSPEIGSTAGVNQRPGQPWSRAAVEPEHCLAMFVLRRRGGFALGPGVAALCVVCKLIFVGPLFAIACP